MLVSREEAQQEYAKYIALAAEQSRQAMSQAGSANGHEAAVVAAQVATANAISALAAAVMSIAGYE